MILLFATTAQGVNDVSLLLAVLLALSLGLGQGDLVSLNVSAISVDSGHTFSFKLI